MVHVADVAQGPQAGVKHGSGFPVAAVVSLRGGCGGPGGIVSAVHCASIEQASKRASVNRIAVIKIRKVPMYLNLFVGLCAPRLQALAMN